MDILSIKTILAEKANEVNHVAAAMRHRLEKRSSGSLRIKRVNGNLRYFEKNGPSLKYVSPKKRDLIKELQEYSYWEKLYATAMNESSVLQEILGKLDEMSDYDSVFAEIPDEERDMIVPYKPGVSKHELEEWMNPANWTKVVMPHDNCYTTANGEKVRSKSEVIIADRLKLQEIPYHYEYMKIIDSEKFWFPDFKVINKRTGVEYYWEHFGRMDNPEYCEKTMSKLEKYSENGIYMGKNLIVTMETSNHVLNTQYVDEMIRQYLI